jgi:hypothetical protein
MSKTEYTQGVLFEDDGKEPAKNILEENDKYTLYEDGTVKVHAQNENPTRVVIRKRITKRYSEFNT